MSPTIDCRDLLELVEVRQGRADRRVPVDSPRDATVVYADQIGIGDIVVFRATAEYSNIGHVFHRVKDICWDDDESKYYPLHFFEQGDANPDGTWIGSHQVEALVVRVYRPNVGAVYRWQYPWKVDWPPPVPICMQ